MPQVRTSSYSTPLNAVFTVDLDEICGTGVDVIAIMIHEGYTRSSGSLQTNASAGVAWQPVINRWGSSQTCAGDWVWAVLLKNPTKHGLHKQKTPQKMNRNTPPCVLFFPLPLSCHTFKLCSW